MVLLPNLYALPFEIFKKSVFFQINCPYWLYTKKEKTKGKNPKETKTKGKWKSCCCSVKNWGTATCGAITCFVCLPIFFGQ
jgi:hypothetical protein